jgi:hypothetical protein
VVSEDFSKNRGFSSAYNCDLLKQGSVFKSNSSQGILLRAESGGASCDYLGYSDLRYNQGYILRIAGENRDGRSLKIYLFNENLQMPEVEEILPSGKFDKTYFIYPKNIKGSGYVLNLESRSFGRIPSENLLTKVEFYTYDFNYTGGHKPVANNLVIGRVRKFGTWGYGVETSSNGLLELGQGFEKGWIGFTKNDLGIKVLEHVKVNSWANGWLIDDQPSVIYLVFWPQILEWGGMFIGAVTLLALVFKRR